MKSQGIPHWQICNILAITVTHELITVTNDTYINAQSVCELLRKIAALKLGVLDGTVDISLWGGFRPKSGDAFQVFTASNGITDLGLDLTWDTTGLLPAQYWNYRIAAFSGPGSGRALELFVGVPEPASVLLLALGAAAWLFWAARRKRAR